jgi:chromosomal replication initiation ATPase DnaA
MAGSSRQIPIPLSHRPAYDRESFIVGKANRAALQLIEKWPAWPAPVVVLTGPPGSGKTHLAHIWTKLAAGRLIKAEQFAQPNAGIVVTGPTAIDGIDMDSVPEKALFHLMNMAAEAAAALLLTSRMPVADWQVGLPDLNSRLRLAAPAELTAPDDALLRQVMVKLFTDRQLFIDKSVVDYILLRMERSLASAARIVSALDQAALSAGRRITRPLAADVLEADGGPETQPDGEKTVGL